MKRLVSAVALVMLCVVVAANKVHAGGEECDCGPLQGLTPGFWKNHPKAWPISTNITVGSVFENVNKKLAGKTLLQALSFQGGSDLVGAQEILLRAGVAALLNSITLNYPLTPDEVVNFVSGALGSGNRDTILELAELLDDFNNLGVDE